MAGLYIRNRSVELSAIIIDSVVITMMVIWDAMTLLWRQYNDNWWVIMFCPSLLSGCQWLKARSALDVTWSRASTSIKTLSTAASFPRKQSRLSMTTATNLMTSSSRPIRNVVSGILWYHYDMDKLSVLLGLGLLSQFPPFRYFPKFAALWKYTLDIKYHVYIWQVSPQLSWGDTCQIWMLFKEPNSYFCKMKKLRRN